jgi:hypothetical protein
MEHEFEPLSGRCVHCGTRFAHHVQVPQPCPQQGTRAEPLRPEPKRREYAVEDAATISLRLSELAADRLAVLNQPPDPIS